MNDDFSSSNRSHLHDDHSNNTRSDPIQSFPTCQFQFQHGIKLVSNLLMTGLLLLVSFSFVSADDGDDDEEEGG